MRNEIVKNNLHFKGVVAREAVLNYESGILSTEGLKIGGLGSGPLLKMGIFQNWPTREKRGFWSYFFVKDHEKDDRFLAAQVEKVEF